MSIAREQYLSVMGIPVWVRRGDESPAESATAISALDWDVLAERVRSCTSCGLHGGRIQTVFGVGSADADLLIVGEAPGAEEDRRGEPHRGGHV